MWRAKLKLKCMPGSSLYFGRPLPKYSHPINDWIARAYINEDGFLYLPSSALKSALLQAANMNDPCRERALLVQRCIAIPGSMILRTNPDAYRGERLRAADLQQRIHWVRNSARSYTKSQKAWPVLNDWTAIADVVVFSDKLSEEYLRKLLRTAGAYVGFGAMRVGNGGCNGQFRLANLYLPKI